jgi:putative DNA-invertase from lambdoid prophage Rac
MSHLAYFRVSTLDQSIESQRQALRGDQAFDREFVDEGVSGATLAKQRPGFKALLDYARDGDTVYVYAVDRLGRDALDVQQTVRDLLAKGVSVNVRGLGLIGKGVGELILAVLAQVADMERQRIRERTEAGRKTAREALETTGLTHKGKTSLGRPRTVEPSTLKEWRTANQASLSQTAERFGVSLATVKRAMAA